MRGVHMGRSIEEIEFIASSKTWVMVHEALAERAMTELTCSQ